MKVAEGILTELGGMTSHAAVVARGMGVTAITGCHTLNIDYKNGTATTEEGTVIKRGDVITIDGLAGEVMLGDIPKTLASSSDDFQTLLSWADKYRKLQVRANAETPEDAAKAIELGAEGIGLCRTEHMFFDASRINIMRGMILSENKDERESYLTQLEKFQHDDFLELFRIMDGKPITIRLLDPPLHEFLPHTEEDIEALGKQINKSLEKIRQAIDDLVEVNPMLGLRGCRLSIVHPEITEMQVRAITSAAVAATEAGINPMPEIMIPLVVNVREIRMITDIIEHGIHSIMSEKSLFSLQDRHYDGDAESLPGRRTNCQRRGIHEFRNE